EPGSRSPRTPPPSPEKGIKTQPAKGGQFSTGADKSDQRWLGHRATAFGAHWRRGRQCGIPMCCRLHFCCDSALVRLVGVTRWREIANWETPLIDRDPWVPCGVKHAGYSPYGP